MLVQAEVAERLAAAPGSAAYGIPSVKAAWYGDVRRAGSVGRTRVLARAQRRLGARGADPAPAAGGRPAGHLRRRRRRLRHPPQGAAGGAARWAGSPAAAEARLRAAGIDPSTRGEQLSVTDFARLAATDPVQP